MKRVARLGLACLVTSLTAAPALAFKEPGHRAIEAEAYRELASTMAGRNALVTLLDYGVLKAPAQPVPLPSEELDSEFDMLRIDALITRTHIADHLMDRQFQADRQCFHFNARGAHTTLTDAPLKGFENVPRGLVVDAYIECLGVVDALLRGILFDPAATHEQNTDVYALMHMIEDSFSDAHVARGAPVAPLTAASPPGQNQILFVKPWNLRTWARYFLGGVAAEPVHQHFSPTHHMGADTRDLGYLVGPTDENYEQVKRAQPAYQARIARCLKDARPLVRPKDSLEARKPLQLDQLYGEVVPPLSCFSDRALAAKDALVDLLELIATYVPLVRAPQSVPDGHRTAALRKVAATAGAASVSFEDAWLRYRRRHLGHRIDALTVGMAMGADPASPRVPVPSDAEAEIWRQRSLRRDHVSPASALAPRQFKEAGFGLGVEVRGGTPLWLGLDEFVSRKSTNHNRTIILLDTLGWGLQVRLPIENELGERPVGAGFDIGPGLPLPLSEIISLEELQIYVGARARVAYTAQAIFEGETRHSLEFGFGGVSLDLVIGGQAWLGIDAFRRMYLHDFWDPENSGWSPLTFGLAGGVAVDAL